ncbi:DUF3194 domain-containing protein [Salinirussus salinus]|jgi:hypothetical protein|uniref:DUF3194 domain-containing protein n=1 Tax=Salinirussus salinus TaxID=1198300 RepID=UPI00135B4C3C|nr:DUF3194 domain-containing protein [Salinirussus salinus]
MTDNTDDGTAEPSDDEVVRAAAQAAEDVVFSRYDRAAVRDLDVTVTFEDGVLEVDVYLDAEGGDPDRVADDAALAARGAADDLLL